MLSAEWQSARNRREAWSADDQRVWALSGQGNTPRRMLLVQDRGYRQQQLKQQQANVVYTRQVSSQVYGVDITRIRLLHFVTLLLLHAICYILVCSFRRGN